MRMPLHNKLPSHYSRIAETQNEKRKRKIHEIKCKTIRKALEDELLLTEVLKNQC